MPSRLGTFLAKEDDLDAVAAYGAYKQGRDWQQQRRPQGAYEADACAGRVGSRDNRA